MAKSVKAKPEWNVYHILMYKNGIPCWSKIGKIMSSAPKSFRQDFIKNLIKRLPEDKEIKKIIAKI